MPFAPGERIGRYDVIDRLGAGGMGEVFRARDSDLGREVAIKVLPERFASNPDRLARFTQEARAASSLNHPNIVTIHEIGQASGLPFIVMERVEGTTLREFVQPRALTTKKILDVAVQLADGLAKAHEAGIVHRDLKPENIMVTGDGFVKILDFGLAKLREAEPEASVATAGRTADADTRATGATVAGAVLGTAGYMSPEQALGRQVDYRSDQFSLGTVLYELVTGRRAFAADSVVQTLNAIIERDPEPIADLNRSFPAPARWAIERCLAKEPSDRYSSTRDLAAELRNVRDHLSETTSEAPHLIVRAKPHRGGFRSWHVGLAAVLVVAGVLLAGPVRNAIVGWLRPPMPGRMRVAVLPVAVTPANADDSACCGGLLDYVVVRLSDLNRVASGISVVPASEVLEAGVASPSAARRVLGANVAVSIAIQRSAGAFVVNASLADTEQVQQLTAESRSFSSESFSPEAVAELVVELLRVQWDSNKKASWSRNAPAVSEAGVLFAQGLGKTPYQQAKNALDRYEQEQSLQRAIDLFNRAIDLDPKYAAAHAGLGEARLRLYRLTKHASDLDLAQASLNKALALDDTRPSTWIALGMLHAQKGRAAEAEKAFAQAIARNPLDADAHRELGLAYLRAAQPEKAEAALRKAIELRSDSWSNHNALGYFFYVRSRLPEAKAEFQKAVALAPDSARAWSNLGGVALAEGRADEAEAAFKSALRVARYGAAYSNLGTLQYRARRFTEAARTFEQAVQVSPRDGTIWWNLGSAYYHAPGERDRARAAYERAASLLEEERRVDPTNAETLAELGDAYAMSGRADDARRVLPQVLAGNPSANDLATTASAYEHVGDRDAALKAAAAALHAGMEPQAIDQASEMDGFRKDPRWAALVKRVREEQKKKETP